MASTNYAILAFLFLFILTAVSLRFVLYTPNQHTSIQTEEQFNELQEFDESNSEISLYDITPKNISNNSSTVSSIKSSSADWCPVGGIMKRQYNNEEVKIVIINKEIRNGIEVCHWLYLIGSENSIEVWWDNSTMQ